MTTDPIDPQDFGTPEETQTTAKKDTAREIFAFEIDKVSSDNDLFDFRPQTITEDGDEVEAPKGLPAITPAEGYGLPTITVGGTKEPASAEKGKSQGKTEPSKSGSQPS